MPAAPPCKMLMIYSLNHPDLAAPLLWGTAERNALSGERSFTAAVRLVWTSPSGSWDQFP
jgi:hypothetical protein